MKKRFFTFMLAALFLFALWPAPAAQAADVGDYTVYFSNFNKYNVKSDPEYAPGFWVEDENLLVQSISTYHWNGGRGMNPGTISLYDWDDNLIGSWKATGRAGSGVNNVYWDVFPNLILEPGHYYVMPSSRKSWSCNDESKNAGFVEIRGRDAGINVSINGTNILEKEGVHPPQGVTNGTRDSMKICLASEEHG